MGHIVIEIPGKESRFYRLHNEDTIEKFLSDLERIVQKDTAEEDEDILSLWTAPEPMKNSISRRVFVSASSFGPL